MLGIFISSVQKELAQEREALCVYLRGDALLRRFFEPFLFEELPAADRRADACYLEEVERCDIYLGIFGNEYGWEDAEGLSPTHREFRKATELGKTRLVYIKGNDDSQRRIKMQSLIAEAGAQLIRRRVNSAEELIAGVYAKYIERMGTGIRDMIQRCRDAGLPEPEIRIDAGVWVTTIRRKSPEVTPEVAPEVTPEATPEVRLARVLVGEMTRQRLQQELGLKDDEHFRKAYLLPALEAGLIEMTISDKPRSSRQKYRLTATGRALLANGGQA